MIQTVSLACFALFHLVFTVVDYSCMLLQYRRIPAQYALSEVLRFYVVVNGFQPSFTAANMMRWMDTQWAWTLVSSHSSTAFGDPEQMNSCSYWHL